MTGTDLTGPLEDACRMIVELCGECPAHRLGLPEDGCERLCRPGVEAECWYDYYTLERWVDE